MKIKRILVSQPKPASERSAYFDIAEKYGVEIVFRPLIRVERLPIKDFRQQRINLPDYNCIVFTSRHAIDHFFDMCKEVRYVVPEDTHYFCVSEKVALYIQKYVQYRKRKVHFGVNGKITDLVSAVGKHAAGKFLVPMSDVHTNEVSDFLDSMNVDHTESVMYRTVSADFGPEEQLDYDMIVFFSPAGVNSLLKNFPDFQQGEIAIGCLGPVTAQTVCNAGLRLDMEAPTPNYPSITAALDAFIGERNKE